MSAERIKVFDNAYLSDRTDFVERQVSHVIAVPNETLVVHGSVINFAGTAPSISIQAEGSYDGQAWQTTGMPTAVSIASSPEAKASNAVAIDYPYVRLRATVFSEGMPSPDGEVLFDADVVFTHQVN